MSEFHSVLQRIKQRKEGEARIAARLKEMEAEGQVDNSKQGGGRSRIRPRLRRKGLLDGLPPGAIMR